MGKIVYELKDHLDHQQYEWPLSLVRYPLQLQPGEATPDSLVLRDGEGRRVPAQLVGAELREGFVTGGAIAFLTDLPRGATRRYELTYGMTAAPALVAIAEAHEGEASSRGITVREEGDTLRFSNGLIEVAVPRVGITIAGSAALQEVFGLHLADGGKMATARLASGQLLCSVQSEIVSSGPVLHEQRITFLWDNDALYAITIRLAAEMPFVELEEHMQGMSGNRLVVDWTGLNPTRRYTKSRGEEAIDAYLGGGGELPFRILPYDNFHSWHTGRSAAFVDEEQHLAAGLFHGDPMQWNDGEYALWRSSDTLAISFQYCGESGGAADEERLSWIYPLASGVRATKIALYDPDRKRAAQSTAAFRVPITLTVLPLIDELALWHSFLALDKTKDWVLDWEEPQAQYPRLFDPEQLPEEGHLWYFDLHELPRPEDMEEIVDKLSFNFNQVEGTSPVSSREFAFWTPVFDLSARDMTPEQFRRFKASSAMMAYVREDEYVAPIHTMLSGHPNFLADYKAVLGYMSGLFPNHPHSGRWVEHYEKAMALNLKYHTRPDVAAWNAEGGRWTENLGCYVWAALVPMLRSAWCIRKTYGDNALLYPNLAKLAGYLLKSLSAPLRDGRSYPPQGAHAGVHNDPLTPPYALRVLGEMLKHYDPLLAEQLLAVCPVEAPGFESKAHCDVWRLMLQDESPTNVGTPPQLKSVKMTGYGHVLRSAVGTSGEMSVHLQQIDEGPNYRWGRSGDGGNGIIYYYADGKRYSYNRPEDVGDDNMGTGEGSSTFAVLDGHEYKSIGRRELTGPLHDFRFAQFAELLAGPDALPHYRSRSVLMSGNDYIVIYDEVADMRVRGRFSWFSHREDPFPSIYQLKPGAASSPVTLGGPIDGPQVKPGDYRINRKAHGYPDGAVGRYYDGFGDFLTVVTHRGEWQPQIKAVKAMPYGAIVALVGREDHIFRSATRIRHHGENAAFDGYAGIVRLYGNNHAEAALFRGRYIAAAGLAATIKPVAGENSADCGTAGSAGGNESEAAFAFATVAGSLSGRSSSSVPINVRLELPSSHMSRLHRLYVDGKAYEVSTLHSGSGIQTVLEFVLPAGRTEWQWTACDAVPGKPGKICVSIASPTAADVEWDAAAGADRYELAISKDNCRSWKVMVDRIATQRFQLEGLAAGTKLHVKVRACRGEAAGEWSEPFPIYPTELPPAAPQGLRLKRDDGAIQASWGMVLGAQSYRLYRRKLGEIHNELIYEGRERQYLDDRAGQDETESQYAYSIAALNGNGEGLCSLERDTVPGGLIDWDPKPDETFRRYIRSHEYGHNGFNFWENERKGSLPPYPQA
ncbi:fibronectin type III domain-containing protein [Paenibacillus sp. strain BS8-2]